MHFFNHLCGISSWGEKEPEIPILPFDDLAAHTYGRVKADLQREGVSLSQMDALIAAHAKSKELILVSNHIRDFTRVDGLIVEDWG